MQPETQPNYSLSRAQILAAIEATAKEQWQTGIFEGTSPVLYFARTSVVNFSGTSTNFAFQFVFERDILSAETRNIQLQVLPSVENGKIPAGMIQIVNGPDISDAFCDLQSRASSSVRETVQIEARLPQLKSSEIGLTIADQAALALLPEIEEGKIDFEDELINRHAASFIPVVESIFKQGPDEITAVLTSNNLARLAFTLLSFTATPNPGELRNSLKQVFPKFDFLNLDPHVRSLLRLINSSARCLTREVEDPSLQSQQTLSTLHQSLINRSERALLQNFRLAVSGQEPPRHLGQMSGLPERITLGQGGSITVADKIVQLPAFEVIGVELPKSILRLSDEGMINAEELARYEEMNLALCSQTGTPYDLLRHLTPQELEKAHQEVERFEQLTQFERLLELGKYLDALPFYNPGNFEVFLISRTSLTIEQGKQFESLYNLLQKAQKIEDLKNPSAEAAACMRFWGISPENLEKRIKFSPELENLFVAMVFYDDPLTTKNRLVRGNEAYRATSGPGNNGSALALETYLGNMVNSSRLELLSTPTYVAIAEIVEHFNREIRPLTLRYNALFAEGAMEDRPIVADLRSSIRFLSSLKHFYEGAARTSGVQYLTWRQVQVGQEVMASYGVKLQNFLHLYSEATKDKNDDDFTIPALN